MPPTLPPGDPAPMSGELPTEALRRLGERTFGVYLHVPYCRVRCGYCDFNTYAVSAGEVSGGVEDYAGLVLRELDLAQRVLGAGVPPVSTVFVGGGTPTLLPARDLVGMLDGVRTRWGLAPDVEVTTEANPDTVTPALAEELARGGVTRVSVGMQSAVPSVLATLDRTHDPAGVTGAVAAVRDAGLQVSLDLIYGTPGETLADWRRSLEAAVELDPDHISAYALTVEPGTKLAARVSRGQLPMPEDDDEADKYELADDVLRAAGFRWYEISNWARSPQAQCRHNLGYWRDGDWWAAGPGAHSHVDGVRWWNVKHPTAYRDRLLAGLSPAAAREILTPTQRFDERVLLGVRLAEGLPLAEIGSPDTALVAGLIADGLIDPAAALRHQRIRLTRRGRLLADTVVGQLTRRSDIG
ncbi:MAG: radical SAM family heme chaperone HemW [Dermatophilaceae bacterium]